MLPEQVDKMLSSYHKCQSRAAALKAQIEVLQWNISSYDPHEEMLQKALKAQSFDPMPHTNAAHSPVEDLVIKYSSGYRPKYLESFATDIPKMQDEMMEMNTVVKLVDAWLISLTEKERFVIQHHVIQAETWHTVLDQWEPLYGQFGKEGLRKIKKRALEKIYEAAE